MATTSKIVRFYTPYVVDENETQKAIKPGFWGDTAEKAKGLSAKKRTVRHNGMDIFGTRNVSKSPAATYMRIGRVRYPADWPGTVDLVSGAEGSLALTNEQLLESSVLLPFGAKNRVAIMGPIRGLVSVAAMSSWLTAVWGLDIKNKSIVLVPNVDKSAADKLNEALGVSRLQVKIPVDADFEPPADTKLQGGIVQAAVDEAVAGSLGHFDFEATWSMGTREKKSDLAQQLLQGARYLAKTIGPSKIEANMILHDEEGFRVEQHDLINDQIAATVKFDVDESVALDEKAILDAIYDAIAQVT